MTTGPRHRGTPHRRRRTRRAGLAVGCALLCAAAACTGGTATSSLTGVDRTAPPRKAGPQRGFTLVASGDVIPYPTIMNQAQQDAGGSGHDFRKLFAGVRPVVSAADVAICHMETPYGEAGGPFTGYPTFVSPPQVAAALRETGYDSCSTASNHTLDAGADGVRRQLDALDKAGLGHVGSARSAAEGGKPVLLRAGTATVAQLSYTYGTNGIPLPEDKPWIVNTIDPDRIVADARAARRAGADVVVLSLHWGTEWQEEPDAMQRELAARLTRSRSAGRPDIDLVIGTHNHVPQAYEKVNGTWVVHGLGDQVAGVMQDPRGNHGSIARFRFEPPRRDGERWAVTKAEFIPQMTDRGPPWRVVNLGEALRGDPGREDYRKVRDSIREAVMSRGAADDGLVMADR
ncbi:CapA family protein [Streptomyces sp. NPDC047108]|uniref:CapA family protein n=1 Tax=Streptomyces sp. NPDC047108 TaxID=3155025 RepID=UPI0033DA4328